jgi:indole-3-glycerol phosphate synthase
MTVLERITERTRQDLVARKSRVPVSRLQERIDAARVQPPAFAAALGRVGRHGPAVIAELKKASPSRGLIRSDFSVPDLARELVAGGAAALSVLTEPHFFQGCLENLDLARGVVDLPLLRKDFVVDPYQVLEARAYGASAVLLIAAALPADELASLCRMALDHGLDVLAEVHNETELAAAVRACPTLIGVNARDLHSFAVDLDRARALLAAVPRGFVRVAESGIRTHADLEELAAAGADAFLVGERVMAQPSPAEALRELLRGPWVGADGEPSHGDGARSGGSR